MNKKNNRRFWHSKVYKQIKVGSDTVFVPIVDDLETRYLKIHFARAIEQEDYEYAAACQIEAETRGILLKLTS